jgi:SPP1 family phage portal protein
VIFIEHFVNDKNIYDDSCCHEFDSFSNLEDKISDFLYSQKRQKMITGERYYLGFHDILRRVRTTIGDGGRLIEATNLPNNKIIDNQYGKLVDQKVNYLFSKLPTFQCENTQYLSKIGEIFNKKFFRELKIVAENTLNCGICWIYPFFDRFGDLKFKRISGYEILPFWKDETHTDLNFAVRIYDAYDFSIGYKKLVKKVEIYGKLGVYRFIYVNKKLLPDLFHKFSPYFWDFQNDQKIPMNWEKIPLISFKSGAKEISLINRVKSLQDGINVIISDFLNNMESDAHNTILVLKNYDGEDLGEFRRNLAIFGAVKVRTVDGEAGGVDALKIDVNCENYQAILSTFKQALVENGGGFSSRDIISGASPNELTIKSMYTNIDLDANGLENEFQASFEELFSFVNFYLEAKTGLDYSGENIEIIFNRDMLINESEIIDNCIKSSGLISRKTLVENHPFVSNPAFEFDRIKAEEAAKNA